MKTCTVFAATAALAMLSLDSASAMRSYLKKFPNGDAAFTQALGHVGETEVLNDFGKLFSGESNTYSEKLCKSTFPGTSMTVGEAFGDPCCTWKAGGKADFTVTPFTVPTDKKTCAASAPAGGDKPATPAAGGDKPATPAAGGDKPAAPAPAGAATPAPAGKPDTPVVTPAPAGKPDAGKPAAGKPDAPPAPPAGKPDAGKPPAGKPDAGKPPAGKPGKPSKCGVKKEAKSLDEDENDENDDNDNDVFDY